MLQVYTEQGYIPIETRKEYYYLQNYSGFNELYFDVSVKDSLMKYLINEAVILNEDNRFLIKDVNRRTQNATIKCELDLDEWKQTVYFDTANDSKFQTKTLDEVLNAIKPNGWTVSNSLISSIRRTVDLKDAQPYDILIESQKIYSVVYDIDVTHKIIRVVDPDSFKFDGLYATPELNLKGITWQGNSNDFCTRLFAYGKADDNGIPINIRSVNEGKEYIEEHTYNDRVITKVWRDERYTDPQNLLDDAKKKLKELSVPKMSYDISIIDLQTMNEEYDFLAFGLYKVVKTMIDENTSIEQKVVTYKKYYDKCDKNVVTLSNESQTFTSKISSILGGSTNEVLDGSFLDQAKKDSADIINAFARKGLKYETENETYYLDKLPKEAAKYVMRMNLGGIAFSTNGWSGPYTTAWTIDGRFNADFISTGTLNAIKINAAIITGGSINIQNKFIVDGNGKLKCVDGEFSGKIISESGYIGGFAITKDGLSKTTMVQLAKVYTQSDLDRIKNIIMGHVSPTSEDYKLYDINKDGRITASDWLMVEQIFVPIQSDKLYTDVIINSYPYDPNNINQPMIIVRYRGASGKIAMSSEISARRAIVHFFRAVSITTKYISCYNGDGDYSLSTDNIDIIAKNGGEGNQVGCGDLYGGTYSGTDNVYLRCFSGYLALYSADNALYYNGNYIDSDWSGGKFYPSVKSGVALGTSGNRWYRLYAANACSTSSDRRLKKDITYLSQMPVMLNSGENKNMYEVFFDNLKPISFVMKDDTCNRIRFGFVAQDVIDALNTVGLTAYDVDFVSHGRNENDEIDENEMYSLCYEEFISLNTHMIQKALKKIDEQQKEINDLKKEIEELKKFLIK